MNEVRLIGVTKPVVEELNTSEQLLAFCARVSSTANQLNHETGPRLIASLIRRKEWSPLEMVSATVEIYTTRDIARQILRHRSFSFQEFSQRYAEVKEDFVKRETRVPHPTDRQMSLPCEDEALDRQWQNAQDRLAAHARDTYTWAISAGVAKEVARSVLPEGMTPSRLYMAGTLRSWIHYIGLRCDIKTQKEHRDVAFQIAWALCAEYPVINDILDQIGDPAGAQS